MITTIDAGMILKNFARQMVYIYIWGPIYPCIYGCPRKEKVSPVGL